MTTPLISDEELIRMGCAPGTLPGVDQSVRDDHRAAASGVFIGVLGSRYFVPDDWVTTDHNLKLQVATVASFTLLQWRGFDPETDKQVMKRWDAAMQCLELMEKGRYRVDLRARRRVKMGSALASPGSAWFDWRGAIGSICRNPDGLGS